MQHCCLGTNETSVQIFRHFLTVLQGVKYLLHLLKSGFKLFAQRRHVCYQKTLLDSQYFILLITAIQWHKWQPADWLIKGTLTRNTLWQQKLLLLSQIVVRNSLLPGLPSFSSQLFWQEPSSVCLRMWRSYSTQIDPVTDLKFFKPLQQLANVKWSICLKKR